MNDTKEIMKELEQGVQNVYTSDNYINYLATMSKFYHYSINNTILIFMQMPNASRVAGYKAWQGEYIASVDDVLIGYGTSKGFVYLAEEILDEH